MVLIAQSDGTSYVQDADGKRRCEWPSPLEALGWLDESRRQMDADQRWVGYLSYDLGRWFERVPTTAADDLHLPLMVFSCHRTRPVEPIIRPAGDVRGSVRGSTLERQAYLDAVDKAVAYISAGDIFQVNLAQRLCVESNLTPEQAYARMQSGYPAEYAAMLDYGEFALLCNSPELFLRVWCDGDSRRRVLTRPIKGTRPRRPGMDRELADSQKDAAELNMIVDLERNDLGRICRIGSVRVTQPRTIEMHPTVYHGVAGVEGELRPEVGLVELLRATFPGGSITGAPKIRAMEIIEELEPVRRGPYCGAIGYIDADGTMQFNIAIRTIIAARGKFYIPVGGGIVADSQPLNEYDETRTKALATMESLGVAGFG